MSAVQASLTVGLSGQFDVGSAFYAWAADRGEILDARTVSRRSRESPLRLTRITFTVPNAGDLPMLREEFATFTDHLLLQGQSCDAACDLNWRLSTVSGHRILIMVSRTMYAASAVLGQHEEGLLADARITGVVSNHLDAAAHAELRGVPFVHIPTGDSAESKAEAERRLLHLVITQRITVLVLARYMQVLSPMLCAELEAAGVTVINLHHGDVAAYPGARPGRRALERGSRKIAATVHVATKDLDMGPIIDQEFWRLPPAASEQDIARLQWRGGALLAETLWAWLSGRVVLCGSTAEII